MNGPPAEASVVRSMDHVEKILLGQKASVLGLRPDVIVGVETTLGHDWILAEAKGTGIAPAMAVIGMGGTAPA